VVFAMPRKSGRLGDMAGSVIIYVILISIYHLIRWLRYMRVEVRKVGGVDRSLVKHVILLSRKNM
jgi:hypothetical protein